jgi:glutamine synthetase type III
MKIELGSAITIIVGLCALVGYIWQLAEIKADINARIVKSSSDINLRITSLESQLVTQIDGLKDTLVDRVYDTDKKLEVHLTEHKGEKLFSEYRHNSTDKLVEHKFNRLANWIDQIAGFLNKQSGFQIRDDKY